MGNEQEVADAWAWFKESGSLDARNWLTVHYSPMIRGIAIKAHRRLQGHVEVDDLISFGAIGLMNAIERFDPDRVRMVDGVAKKVAFKTFATPRVWGQMFDEVRKLSWIPRNVLAKARDLEKARAECEVLLGRPAEHAEVAEYLGLEIGEYFRLADQSQVSIVPLVSEVVTSEFDAFEGNWNTAEIDHSSNPEDAYQVNRISAKISEAVAGMDERLRTIIALHYLQDMTLAEIGDLLGITGGRVSQLVSRALAEIRDDLGAIAA